MALKRQQDPIPDNFINVRQPAMGGLNTLMDVHDIKDQETPDMNNMFFDAGVIGPRTGSTLFAAKPTGEAASPLQAMVAKTSDGLEYLVTIYGTNFYFWDSTNNYHVKINHTFVPTKISYYGYLSWDAGFGTDRLYFCNGTDDVARWRMAVNYLAASQLSSDTTITLKDSTRFYSRQYSITGVSGNNITVSNSAGEDLPTGQMVYYQTSGSVIAGLTNNTVYYVYSYNGNNSTTIELSSSLANAKAGTPITLSGSGSGTQTLSVVEPIIISDGTNYVYAQYYANSSNVLTLTAALGTAVSANATVVSEITDRPGMQIGKILTKNQQRLWSANKTGGGEVNIYWSATGYPEDYTGGNNITDSGFLALTDGDGAVTGLYDFGEFVIAMKEDSMNRIEFVINSNLSASITQVTPIVSGKSVGSIALQSTLKASNSLYFPTRLNGIQNLAPVATGFTTTLGINNISYNIYNYVTNTLSFAYDSRCAYYKQKIHWTCSTGQSNNIVLVYDMIRNAWTRYDNWNPADMFVIGTNFYYISSIDGNIYQGYSSYTDNSTPYNVYFFTKLNNYGQQALPKTMDAIYIEGYMTQSTSFFADVFYNEKGRLIKKTYNLNINTPNFDFTNVRIDALGQIPINQGILDSFSPSQIQNFGYFRCYLSVPNAYGFFTAQIKFYSTAANSVWFVTGHGENPHVELIIPPLLRISPVN